MQEETMRGKGCVPHLRGYEMREGKEERSNASDSKSNHVQQDKGEGKIIIKNRKRKEQSFQRRRTSQERGAKETRKPKKKPAKNHDQERRLVS